MASNKRYLKGSLIPIAMCQKATWNVFKVTKIDAFVSQTTKQFNPQHSGEDAENMYQIKQKYQLGINTNNLFG